MEDPIIDLGDRDLPDEEEEEKEGGDDDDQEEANNVLAVRFLSSIFFFIFCFVFCFSGLSARLLWGPPGFLERGPPFLQGRAWSRRRRAFRSFREEKPLGNVSASVSMLNLSGSTLFPIHSCSNHIDTLQLRGIPVQVTSIPYNHELFRFESHRSFTIMSFLY